MSKNSQAELQLRGSLTAISFVHYLKVKKKTKLFFLLLVLLLSLLFYFSKLRDYWCGIYFHRLVYLRKKKPVF